MLCRSPSYCVSRKRNELRLKTIFFIFFIDCLKSKDSDFKIIKTFKLHFRNSCRHHKAFRNALSVPRCSDLVVHSPFTEEWWWKVEYFSKVSNVSGFCLFYVLWNEIGFNKSIFNENSKYDLPRPCKGTFSASKVAYKGTIARWAFAKVDKHLEHLDWKIQEPILLALTF